MVYSETLGIAGTIDAIGVLPDGKRVMIDWKTNARIDVTPRFDVSCEYPLEHIPDTNFAKYMLQLSLYKYIYDKPIDELWLVHLTKKGYEIIKVDYREEDLLMMFNHKKLC